MIYWHKGNTGARVLIYVELSAALNGYSKQEVRGALCRPIKLLLSAGNVNDIKSVTWLNDFFSD